jgi:hypothetical protein
MRTSAIYLLLILFFITHHASATPMLSNITIVMSGILPTCFLYSRATYDLALADVVSGKYPYLQNITIIGLPLGDQCGDDVGNALEAAVELTNSDPKPLAIVGPNTWIDILNAYTRQHNIIQFAPFTFAVGNLPPGNSVVRMENVENTQGPILAALCQRYGFIEVMVLYNTNYQDQLGTFSAATTTLGVSIVAQQGFTAPVTASVNFFTDLTSQIEFFKASGNYILVLIVHNTDVTCVLDQLKASGMLDGDNRVQLIVNDAVVRAPVTMQPYVSYLVGAIGVYQLFDVLTPEYLSLQSRVNALWVAQGNSLPAPTETYGAIPIYEAAHIAI